MFSQTAHVLSTMALTLALVDTVNKHVASLANAWRGVSSIWARLVIGETRAVEARDPLAAPSKVCLRVNLRSEKRLQHTIEKALHDLIVVHKRRGQEARSFIKDSSGQEARSAGRRDLADVQSKRHKVVQTLVRARCSKLGAAEEQSGNVGARVDERVRRRTTVPFLRECLVQVEGCDVGVVCVVGISAVWQSTGDENALGGSDGEPADTSVELRV